MAAALSSRTEGGSEDGLADAWDEISEGAGNGAGPGPGAPPREAHPAEPEQPPWIPVEAFTLHAIPGDGRCMFRALAVAMADSKGERPPEGRAQTVAADALRGRVFRALGGDGYEPGGQSDPHVAHPAATFAAELDGPLSTYCERLRSPRFWGGEPELLVLSNEVDETIRVYVVARREEPGVEAAGRPKLGARLGFRAIQTYPAADGAPPASPLSGLHLLYRGECHYDALLPVKPRPRL